MALVAVLVVPKERARSARVPVAPEISAVIQMFRSERQFTDRFTVQVIDVLPNGNLVVAGKRNMAVHGDTRKLTLTGCGSNI